MECKNTAFVRGKNYMTLEQPRWIPVDERLPKPQKDDDDFSDWVQVSIRIDSCHSIVCSARYCFYTKRWCAERGYREVEAWQPLPEPYKAESESEIDYMRGYKDGKSDALDKIRAEIEQIDFDFGDFYDNTDSIVKMVLQVIDKCKTESEE